MGGSSTWAVLERGSEAPTERLRARRFGFPANLRKTQLSSRKYTLTARMSTAAKVYGARPVRRRLALDTSFILSYHRREINGSGPTTCWQKPPFAGVEENFHRSTCDLILSIRRFAPKKATLGMKSGRTEIKLCPQRPETSIFAHTQEAHYLE